VRGFVRGGSDIGAGREGNAVAARVGIRVECLGGVGCRTADRCPSALDTVAPEQPLDLVLVGKLATGRRDASGGRRLHHLHSCPLARRGGRGLGIFKPLDERALSSGELRAMLGCGAIADPSPSIPFRPRHWSIVLQAHAYVPA
jgi:hypothetical protein